MNKNGILAFVLAFIPGLGHLYLNKKGRAVLYAIGFWFPVVFGLGLALATYDDAPLLILGVSLVVWGVNMLDMLVTLLTASSVSVPTQSTDGSSAQSTANPSSDRNERFFTMLLSFIPGLGHFQLGLMNRGLTFLIGFFGLTMMIVFVSVLANEAGVLVFLGALPVIWVYSFFDAAKLLHRKQAGEALVDRTVFEEYDENREAGKKSKMIATLLAVFPGAGHMYLGLQRRGLQLMAAFLFSIYILDVLHLSIFLFLIPIIWFFNFFDALQHVSKYGEAELHDRPIVNYLINHQKWVGIGLLLLGGFYLLDNVFVPVLAGYFSRILHIDLYLWYHQYFQTTVVSVILIGGGLKLLFGSNRKNREESQ